jgi:hypothetical protein
VARRAALVFLEDGCRKKAAGGGGLPAPANKQRQGSRDAPRDGAVASRDAAVAPTDSAVAPRGALVASRDAIIVSRDADVVSRDAIVASVGATTSELLSGRAMRKSERGSPPWRVDNRDGRAAGSVEVVHRGHTAPRVFGPGAERGGAGAACEDVRCVPTTPPRQVVSPSSATRSATTVLL